MDTLNRYLMNIRCTGTDIILVTKDETLRSENLTRLKDIEDVLPWYLKLRTKRDLANTEELTIKSLKNTYKGLLCQQSAKAALNLGRGLTAPIMQFDEGAFLYNIEISLSAALAAGAAARDIARDNDEPFGTVITTTAGKKDDRDGRFIFSIVNGAAEWNEKFFDAPTPAALEEMVRKASPDNDLSVNCTFSHRQLGLSDEWMRRTLEESRSKGDAASRDFFNNWTSGSQLTPFPASLAEIIKNSKVDDCYMEIDNAYSYATRWFIPEREISQRMNTGWYIMGIDSSDAAGGDDIALVMRDIRTGEVVCAGNYNETNLLSFSEWLASWFSRFTNFVLILERRSSGASILDNLIIMLLSKGIDPFKRLYNRVVQDAEEYEDRFKEIDKPLFARSRDIYVKLKRTFGFATSASGATSRSDLYGTTLINAVKHTGELVKDAKTINQILGLEIRNGRVDHALGEHDDNCIAWLLGYWLLSNGKNLAFYGINPKEILSNKAKVLSTDPKERYRLNEQRQIRESITTLADALKKERDEFITQKLETQLRVLANKLVLEDTEYFSIDNLMNSIREQRQVMRSVGTQRPGGYYSQPNAVTTQNYYR